MRGVREVRLLAEGSVTGEVSLSGGGDTQTHLACMRDRFGIPISHAHEVSLKSPHVETGDVTSLMSKAQMINMWRN